LALDLDVDPGREVELHQRVQGLLRRLDDVEQALVSTDLELLARLLVDVRAAEDRVPADLGGERDRTRNVGARALRRLDDVARGLVEELVIERLEADTDLGRVGHFFLLSQARILVTTPAPTVLPPSRMAKRICSSSATGAMSSIVMVMLSPGITILTPSGRFTVPVTSVVRM